MELTTRIRLKNQGHELLNGFELMAYVDHVGDARIDDGGVIDMLRRRWIFEGEFDIVGEETEDDGDQITLTLTLKGVTELNSVFQVLPNEIIQRAKLEVK